MTDESVHVALADDPRVAAARLSDCPVLLFSLDGQRLLWANAAGRAMLGTSRHSTETSPPLPADQARSLARVAGGLATAGAFRLERLRLGVSGQFEPLACRCSRLVLADGSRALLVEALSMPPGLRLPKPAPSAEPSREQPSSPQPPPTSESISTIEMPILAGQADSAAIDSVDPLPEISEVPAIAEIADREADLAPAAEAAPRSLPIRFIFETDADGRITFLSPEAVTALGQVAARLFGRSWSDAATELGLDPDGKVEAALARRETWSGIDIEWPFADGTRRQVGLAALPMFDKGRNFRGYRGFGVCRSDENAWTDDAVAETRPPAEPPAVERQKVPSLPPDGDPKVIDFEARTGVRGFRESAERAALSAAERSAFREIARTLGSRLEGSAAEALAPETRLAEPEPRRATQGLPENFEPSVAELRASLDLLGDAILVLDAGGAIQRLTAGAAAFFGYSAGDLVGIAFTALLAEPARVPALDYFEGVRRGGGSPLFAEGREAAAQLRSGATVPVHIRIGRLEGDAFCLLVRDVSRWHRAEEELVSARHKSERASSQKSDFLAKISHEIRTPLNAIIGFSELMVEERFGPVGNPRYREYLGDIRASGEHLISLVNDLLDLSKIEAGKLDLNFARVDLNEVVRQCVAIMQPQSNAQQIIMRSSLSRTLPPVVADERSVRQIVLNLLSNAVKFTPAGGQVIVATALTDSGEAVIRVRDTGNGMSERDIATALEPFRQLVTTSPGGTGLGLPLTKALVEANRAAFAIESAVGEGTLVEVIFPPTRVFSE